MTDWVENTLITSFQANGKAAENVTSIEMGTGVSEGRPIFDTPKNRISWRCIRAINTIVDVGEK